MAKEAASSLSEAKLNAPDLDEGVLDVERYPLPDESGITDPYLRKVWAAVRREFAGGTYAGRPEVKTKAAHPWLVKSRDATGHEHAAKSRHGG